MSKNRKHYRDNDLNALTNKSQEAAQEAAESAVKEVAAAAFEASEEAVQEVTEAAEESDAAAEEAEEQIPAIKRAIEQKAAASTDNKPEDAEMPQIKKDSAQPKETAPAPAPEKPAEEKPAEASKEDDNLMLKWYKAALKRVSIRKYSGTPEISVLRELRQVAQMVSTEDARIYVGKREGIFNPLIGKNISGTEAFAAVILRSKNKYMAGFVGEAFVLECVSRGLGTCWLGLSYKKSVARAAVKLREGERIVCVIAIGKYDEQPETAGARKSIFNLTGMEDETFYALPEWQQCAVRCARLAPSARNAQPWEFDIMPDEIQVSITSGNMGYGEIDCGIAMLHIELGAASCGLAGDWIFDEGYPVFRIIKE